MRNSRLRTKEVCYVIDDLFRVQYLRRCQREGVQKVLACFHLPLADAARDQEESGSRDFAAMWGQSAAGIGREGQTLVGCRLLWQAVLFSGKSQNKTTSSLCISQSSLASLARHDVPML